MYSEVPLKAREVIEAILHDTKVNTPEGYLINQSRNPVEWDKKQDSFRLAHATVRPFLESKDHFFFNKVHALLAFMCLTCLQRDLPDGEPVKEWKLRPFTSNAFVYWPWHIFYAWTERFTNPDLRRFFPRKPKTALEDWELSVNDAIDIHVQKRLSGEDLSSAASASDGMTSSPHAPGQDSDCSDGEPPIFDSITPALDSETQTASESSQRSQRRPSECDPSDAASDSAADEESIMLQVYLSHVEHAITHATSGGYKKARPVNNWKEFRSEIPKPIWSLLCWKLTDVYLRSLSVGRRIRARGTDSHKSRPTAQRFCIRRRLSQH